MRTVYVQDAEDEDDTDEGGRPPPPAQPPPTLKTGKDGQSLGMAQIIVTAATPMVEDGTDKSFPPLAERKGESVQQSQPSQQQQQSQKQPQQQQPQKTQHQNSDSSENGDSVKCKEDQSSSLTDEDTIACIKNEPKDPFNEKSTKENGKFEANFEANFDVAFAETTNDAAAPTTTNTTTTAATNETDTVDTEDEIQALKQVVGGRASIPEELDSNQLARLQNLKESNA